MKYRTILSLAMSLCVCLCLNVFAADTPPLKQGNARVIFVGDSITGQSRNVKTGYAHQFEAAVRATYPNATPQIISLGGSGHSVGSWAGVEKNSREKSVVLDIKTNDVHKVLAQPADVLVIMLGMNDVLAPYVDDTPESIDKWTARYQKLIDALKVRVSPGVLALAGITPCTEDPQSPKNQLISKLNDQIALLAKNNNARLLPTSQTVWDIQMQGRRLRPDYHVTADFVHPTTAGHIGIAMGMLDGLGETAAVDWLRKNRLDEYNKHMASRHTAPFSWEIKQLQANDISDKLSYAITYHWLDTQTQPSVTVNTPQGWQVSPNQLTTATGTFTLTGNANQWQNKLTLNANVNGQTQSTDLYIPAPWLVGYSFVQRLWKQPGYVFMADKAHTPIDDVIESGGDFTKPIDMGKGKTLTWKPYSPSVNFTGKDDPDSVDFAAVTHAGNWEAGYLARWIYSDKDRTCMIQPKTRMFAGYMFLNIWVNGKTVYEGRLRKAPTTTIQLQKGWNALVCRSSHHNWQWQLSLPITGQDGDDLSDLRYSIVSKTNE